MMGAVVWFAVGPRTTTTMNLKESGLVCGRRAFSTALKTAVGAARKSLWFALLGRSAVMREDCDLGVASALEGPRSSWKTVVADAEKACGGSAGLEDSGAHGDGGPTTRHCSQVAGGVTAEGDLRRRGATDGGWTAVQTCGPGKGDVEDGDLTAVARGWDACSATAPWATMLLGGTRMLSLEGTLVVCMSPWARWDDKGQARGAGEKMLEELSPPTSSGEVRDAGNQPQRGEGSSGCRFLLV